MTDPGELRDLAVAAATRAGALLLERFGRTASGVASKSSQTDLVSDADRDAEGVILGMIRRERPDDAIVAEEGGGAAGTSDVRWLVDPLDGTTNFLWGVPQWSVSIAAIDADGDLAGVVHDPCRDETFVASRGDGAWLGGTRLGLEPLTDLRVALIGTGFSYRPDERALQAEVLRGVIPRIRDIRRGGSAALDLAWVAAGRLDGYYESGLSPWDLSAGAALVRAAGGAAGPMAARDGDPDPIFVAARPGLDGPLRDLLREALAD